MPSTVCRGRLRETGIDRCLPVAARHVRTTSDSNAAVPVLHGRNLNSPISAILPSSRSLRPLDIEGQVSRYCRLSASPARCNASLRASALSMPTQPAQMADRMSAAYGAELTHPTQSGREDRRKADANFTLIADARTDQRSMAGTAPTDSQFTRTLNAGPVHCSVWLSPAVEITSSTNHGRPSTPVRRESRRRSESPAALRT